MAQTFNAIVGSIVIIIVVIVLLVTASNRSKDRDTSFAHEIGRTILIAFGIIICMAIIGAIGNAIGDHPGIFYFFGRIAP